MKEIQLTQGQVAKVSDRAFEELSKWSWRAWWSEDMQSFYAGRNVGITKVLMHREIAKTPKGLCCDHINHDTLDNQDENLRNVTSSQNGMNRRGAQSNNKLGERNIRRNGRGFEVQIKKEGKIVFDKTFKNMEAAITARNEALKKYFGEYANI